MKVIIVYAQENSVGNISDYIDSLKLQFPDYEVVYAPVGVHLDILQIPEENKE